MASMDWDDFLRHEAAMYRQLAEKTENAFGKQELLDLAAVCEEVANTIEASDRRVDRPWQKRSTRRCAASRPPAAPPPRAPPPPPSPPRAKRRLSHSPLMFAAPSNFPPLSSYSAM